MTPETMAKLIAVNYADWPAYMGKAKRILEAIKKGQQRDLFEKP